MAHGLQTYRQYISKREILLGSLCMFVLSQITILYITSQLGSSFPRLQLTFSAEKFLSIVQAWKSSGLLVTYYRHFYLDYIIHPVLYGIFLSSFMAWTLNRRNYPPELSFLVILPFAATFLDIIENNIHLFLLTHTDDISAGILMFSGACSWLKWIIAFTCVLVPVVLNLEALWGGARDETNHM